MFCSMDLIQVNKRLGRWDCIISVHWLLYTKGTALETRLGFAEDSEIRRKETAQQWLTGWMDG